MPAAHNSKIIHGIEMKFGRVAENHKLTLFHWDVVFKTSNNFITLKLKSYKTFSEHSSFFSRYKRMTMF